jgi:5-methylcytosine-specific restriction protein A
MVKVMTRLYDTANWKRIAAWQFRRQPLCEACADVVAATLVDHIIPIKAGGAMRDAANLQSLCRECHADKTACEMRGKKWIAKKYRGCDVNGAPRVKSAINLF